MFSDTVTREEVVGGYGGIFNGVVDQGEEAPTPAAPRAITSDCRVPREIAESGGLGEFGFLDTRNLDAPV